MLENVPRDRSCRIFSGESVCLCPQKAAIWSILFRGISLSVVDRCSASLGPSLPTSSIESPKANRVGACATFHLGRLCRPEPLKRSRLSLASYLHGRKRSATVVVLVQGL